MNSKLYDGNCHDVSSDDKFPLDEDCVHKHTIIADKESAKNDLAISTKLLNDQPHILPIDDNEQVNLRSRSSSGNRFVVDK